MARFQVEGAPVSSLSVQGHCSACVDLQGSTQDSVLILLLLGFVLIFIFKSVSDLNWLAWLNEKTEIGFHLRSEILSIQNNVTEKSYCLCRRW